MPADSCTGIIAGNKHMSEIVGLQSSKGRGLFARRVKPIWAGVGPSEACIIEVVAPPKTCRLSIAKPAMETEWGEFEPTQSFNELSFILLADYIVAVAEAFDHRLVKQEAHAV